MKECGTETQAKRIYEASDAATTYFTFPAAFALVAPRVLVQIGDDGVDDGIDGPTTAAVEDEDELDDEAGRPANTTAGSAVGEEAVVADETAANVLSTCLQTAA